MLAVTMLVSVIPTTAFAQSIDETSNVFTEYGNGEAEEIETEVEGLDFQALY